MSDERALSRGESAQMISDTLQKLSSIGISPEELPELEIARASGSTPTRAIIGTPIIFLSDQDQTNPDVVPHEALHIWLSRQNHATDTPPVQIDLEQIKQGDLDNIANLGTSSEADADVQLIISILGIDPYNDPTEGLKSLDESFNNIKERISRDQRFRNNGWSAEGLKAAVAHRLSSLAQANTYINAGLNVQEGMDIEEALVNCLAQSSVYGSFDEIRSQQDETPTRYSLAIQKLFPDPASLVAEVKRAGFQSFITKNIQNIQHIYNELSNAKPPTKEKREIADASFLQRVYVSSIYRNIDKDKIPPVNPREVTPESAYSFNLIQQELDRIEVALSNDRLSNISLTSMISRLNVNTGEIYTGSVEDTSYPIKSTYHSHSDNYSIELSPEELSSKNQLSLFLEELGYSSLQDVLDKEISCVIDNEGNHYPLEEIKTLEKIKSGSGVVVLLNERQEAKGNFSRYAGNEVLFALEVKRDDYGMFNIRAHAALSPSLKTEDSIVVPGDEEQGGSPEQEELNDLLVEILSLNDAPFIEDVKSAILTGEVNSIDNLDNHQKTLLAKIFALSGKNTSEINKILGINMDTKTIAPTSTLFQMQRWQHWFGDKPQYAVNTILGLQLDIDYIIRNPERYENLKQSAKFGDLLAIFVLEKLQQLEEDNTYSQTNRDIAEAERRAQEYKRWKDLEDNLLKETN